MAGPFWGAGAKSDTMDTIVFLHVSKIDKRIQMWVPHDVLQNCFPHACDTHQVMIPTYVVDGQRVEHLNDARGANV